jgi:hypothetical protein
MGNTSCGFGAQRFQDAFPPGSDKGLSVNFPSVPCPNAIISHCGVAGYGFFAHFRQVNPVTQMLRNKTERASLGLFGGNLLEMGQFFYRNDNSLMLLAGNPGRVLPKEQAQRNPGHVGVFSVGEGILPREMLRRNKDGGTH